MNALAAPAPAPAVSEASLVEYYLTQLAQLSPDARLELIARLSHTLKSAALVPEAPGVPAPQQSLLNFAGAWADMPGTDEEIIAYIREARTFTRPEVSLV